jgi:hypothetical protein
METSMHGHAGRVLVGVVVVSLVVDAVVVVGKVALVVVVEGVALVDGVALVVVVDVEVDAVVVVGVVVGVGVVVVVAGNVDAVVVVHSPVWHSQAGRLSLVTPAQSEAFRHGQRLGGLLAGSAAVRGKEQSTVKTIDSFHFGTHS